MKKNKKSRMAVANTASRKEYKQLSDKNKENSINNIIFKIMIVIFIIIIAIAFIFVSGIFNISEIIVEGNERVSKDQIISFCKIEKGINLFSVSKKDIISNIKENSYIDTVNIKRLLPNKIKIIISERKVKYALEVENRYIYINEQGYVLEISNEKPNVSIIDGFSTDLKNINVNDRLNEEDLQKLKMITKIMNVALSNDMEKLITKIYVSNKDKYSIYLDSENKIAHIGNGTDLNTRFLYIKAILKEQSGKKGEIFADGDLNSEYVYFRETI